ncbi:MAG: addiction module toxin, HicA family [Acidobacteria bacterium]|nr:addiction module toxin, HicA family [Acidobacteriota bacterium]
MGKLRVLSGADVCDILRRSGFHEVRRQGSHSIVRRKLENGGTITVPVPMHRTLRRGTSASIMRQSGLSRALFDRWTAGLRPRSPAASGRSRPALSKIPFALLGLHRAFLVVVDHPVLPLRAPEQHHLLDDH